MKALLRSLLRSLLLLGVLSLATFALAELAPGDYAAEMRLDPRLSGESLEALRQRFGLDRSWGERYLAWLGSVLRGELGYSFAHQVPVAALLKPRLGATLLLAGSATLMAWLVALGLGTAAAMRPGGVADRLLSLGSALLLALPELLLVLLLLALASSSGLFPLGGLRSLDAETLGFGATLLDRLHHLLLPALALAASLLPTLLRHVRGAMREALNEPSQQAARGHGIGWARRLVSYVLPTAATTLLPLAGLSFGGLLSSSMLVEIVFAWPGIGPLFLDAILARDLHVATAVLLAAGLLLAAGNAFADLALLQLDPRRRGGTP